MLSEVILSVVSTIIFQNTLNLIVCFRFPS